MAIYGHAACSLVCNQEYNLSFMDREAAVWGALGVLHHDDFAGQS